MWKGPARRVRNRLEVAVRLLENWYATQRNLVSKVWDRSSLRPWAAEKGDKGEAAQAERKLEALRSRLHAVLQLRQGHEELLALLGPHEVASLGVEAALTAFSSLEPFQAGEFTEPLWRAAQDTYSSLLGEAEVNEAPRTLFTSRPRRHAAKASASRGANESQKTARQTTAGLTHSSSKSCRRVWGRSSRSGSAASSSRRWRRPSRRTASGRWQHWGR